MVGAVPKILCGNMVHKRRSCIFRDLGESAIFGRFLAILAMAKMTQNRQNVSK